MDARAASYRWHYVDGVSDCGSFSIVAIAMIGNPFSPDLHLPPHERASLNIAIYEKGKKHWSFFERRVHPEDLAPSHARIGKSTVAWEHDRFVVRIDERTTPGDRPIRGTIVVVPEIRTSWEYTLDEEGLHRWWPIAPTARVVVDLEEPRVSFSGHGYLDANAGEVPLEDTFLRWSWSRTRDGERALVGYDVTLRDGRTRTCAMAIDRTSARSIDGLVRRSLPWSWWGFPRSMLVDEGTRPKIVRSLEDGPFYTRALVSARIDGRDVIAMHEMLSADRLARPWVKRLLRYRMGRA